MIVFKLLFNFVVLIHHYFILFHYWLCQDSDYRDIRFGSDMVTCSHHLGLGGHNLMGAKLEIRRSSTIYQSD